MNKKTALFLALLLAAMTVGCSGDSSSSSQNSSSESSKSDNSGDNSSSEADTVRETEPAETTTLHVSPTESVTSQLGIQQTVSKTIERTEGKNTIQLPLADFVQEGDRISSFTFVIYSADGSNIGEFKGGCGISVNGDCPAATDTGWYQSADFSAPTQGTYGEITWNIPSEIADYLTAGGDVLFGYWWGNATSIRVEEVICNITRTRDVPCDGTVSQQVGKSVGYNDTDNTIRVSLDFLPEGAVPQAVTYNISSTGGFRKFTGAFGYSSPLGYYQSADVVSMTDSSSISLTWIVDTEAKNYAAEDGELMLGYWWSEQPTASLDSVTVKYSLDGSSGYTAPPASSEEKPAASNTGFRSSEEIVRDINVGWNLGNTLESYNTGKSGLSTETGWGNLKTSEAMIKEVKNAGFNAVRIPITWDEHMDGDTIKTEWFDRIEEVVNYAYNNDMYVIINMHHDDYIWLDPNDSEYPNDSTRLKKIWTQIAERFGSYGDRLIFEGINETRTIGSANEWMGGTAPERAVVNKYIQDFVDAVRATGGNNAERSLIVTGYAASAEDVAMNDIIVPNDSHVIVSLHYYAPWRFSDGQSTTFGDSEKSELDAKFAKMKQKFIDKGHPLIIDEFGCVAAADDATRAEYYKYYISAAKKQGIKCFIWDNGVSKGESSFGIFYRGSLTWNDAILKGIMDGAN